MLTLAAVVLASCGGEVKGSVGSSSTTSDTPSHGEASVPPSLGNDAATTVPPLIPPADASEAADASPVADGPADGPNYDAAVSACEATCDTPCGDGGEESAKFCRITCGEMCRHGYGPH